MGKLAYNLGNAYQIGDLRLHNSSVLFQILQAPLERVLDYVKTEETFAATLDQLQDALAYIDATMARLPEARMQRPDAELIRREFTWAADMLRHACHRGVWIAGCAEGQEDTELRQRLAQDAERLLSEYRAIWHARNRPGDFVESEARLEEVRQSYL